MEPKLGGLLLDHFVVLDSATAARRALVIAAVLVLTSSCASIPAQGQAGTMCQPATQDAGLTRLDWITAIVTAADTVNQRLRVAYDLLAVPASEVAIVTD